MEESLEAKESEEGTDQYFESDRNRFSVETFLEKNYQLFAVLSIFGVLSIYVFDLQLGAGNRLQQFSFNESIVQLGFISSQILFLLTAGAIIRRLASHLGGASELLEALLFAPGRDSVELVVFLVSFVSLIISIFSISTTFPRALSFLSQIVGLIFGIGCIFWILHKIERGSQVFDIAEKPDSSEAYIGIVLLSGGISIALFIIGAQIIGVAGPTTIFSFESNEVVSPVIATFGLGVFLVGVVYFIGLLAAILNAFVFWVSAIYQRVISFYRNNLRV